MKIRIEVPVLLYADCEVDDAKLNKDGDLTEDGKQLVFNSLQDVLGKVADEPTDPWIDLTIPFFHDARLYLTDHLFPVHSWDGLSLTSQEGDTPHA